MFFCFLTEHQYLNSWRTPEKMWSIGHGVSTCHCWLQWCVWKWMSTYGRYGAQIYTSSRWSFSFCVLLAGVLGFHILRESNSAEIYGKFEWFAHKNALFELVMQWPMFRLPYVILLEGRLDGIQWDSLLLSFWAGEGRVMVCRWGWRLKG